MLISDEDDEDNVRFTSGPCGPYALVRNALDSAASGLWLVEPELKVASQTSDPGSDGGDPQCLSVPLELSLPTHQWVKDYKDRMQEVADQANLGRVDVTKLRMPPTTSILKNIERHHKDPGMSWLGAWQLCSAHAHGKQWATLMSNELTEIPKRLRCQL